MKTHALASTTSTLTLTCSPSDYVTSHLLNFVLYANSLWSSHSENGSFESLYTFGGA